MRRKARAVEKVKAKGDCVVIFSVDVAVTFETES